MDLSTIEGLSEEQQAAIAELHKTDVAGLKTKNDQLLGEQKSAKAAADEATQAAAESAQTAELEKAKKAGDLETLEQTLKQQFADKETKLGEQIAKRDEMILGSKRDAIISDISSHFIAPEASKLILKSMIDVAYSENGTVTTFKGLDGAMISTDKKAFIDWAGQNAELSQLMKPIDSAGGGAGGSKTTGGAGGNCGKTAAEIMYNQIK